MSVIKLYAPNGHLIVGALAEDQTVRSFTYSYDRHTMVRLYMLDDGTPLPLEGPTMLVDAEGKRWNSTEVEWFTLTKHGSS